MRYRAFREELGLRVANATGLLDFLHIGEPLEIIFVLPMPETKKVQSRIGQPHRTRPDVDNLLKAFFDALLVDDSHIHDVRARKVWGVEGEIVVKTVD